MITKQKAVKSFFKKAVSFLLVICMMSGFIAPLMSVTASAAAPSSYTNISADSTAYVSISSSSSSKYFKFVPAYSGTYAFYSTNSSGDPYGYLRDADGNYLASSDDYSGTDFYISYYCTAGTTYYIEACMYGSRTGSYTLKVETISAIPSTPSANTVEVNAAGGTNYPLFNSGLLTSSAQSRDGNYDESSFNNNGYDLTSNNSSSNIAYGYDRMRLGLSFTMNIQTDEFSTVTIYGYDIDENGNSSYSTHKERDYVFLVDETAGAEYQLDGYMSGLDNQWSTTRFNIDSNLLVEGHTYHFEFLTNCVCGANCGWWSYVRTVDLIVNGGVEPPVVPTTGIQSAELTASISSSGTVSVNLLANAYTAENYALEYKAVCSSAGVQYGGKEYTVTVPTYAESFETSFQLESGAPRGTYEITVFIKSGISVIATRSVTVSYGYSAVSYNSNGGSQNLPTDTQTYSSGDTVTVKFDYVPSLYGYTFLGWSADRYATEPAYTENGTNTFTIGSSDVTLYAIWRSAACDHNFSETSRTDATCTVAGVVINTCSDCGAEEETDIPELGHNYVSGVCSRCGASEPQVDIWDGTVDTSWYNGNDTEFTLTTAEELAGLARLVNGGDNFYGKTIYLGCDIDLAGLEWTPIGKGTERGSDYTIESLYFSGVFDGNYFTVSNISITQNDTSFSGLFGALKNATVECLAVDGVNINQVTVNRNKCGGIAGIAENSTIRICSATDVTLRGYATNNPASFGGILGIAGGSVVIENCFAEVDISAGGHCGGIVGGEYSSPLSVNNCYAVGTIVETGESTNSSCVAAGLVAYIQNSYYVSISNCFFSGSITGSDSVYLYSDGANESNCYHSDNTSVSNFQNRSWVESNLGWDFDAVWEFGFGSDYPVLVGFDGTSNPTCSHSYTETSRTDATCTAEGIIVITCTACGDEKESYIPELGHNYVSGVCSRCGASEPQADIWDGSVDTSWYNGSYTEFTITTAEELAGLAELVNSGNSMSGKTIYLGNSIDLAGLEWTPIGQNSYFSGEFDGNYHIIYNLTITSQKRYAGLFGQTSNATVSNVGLKNVNIDVSYSGNWTAIGALVGYHSGGVTSNCFMEGSVKVSNNDQIPTGGLIGILVSGELYNSYAISTVYVSSSRYTRAGGLIGATGWYHSETVRIENCFAISNVTAESSYNAQAGGLIGDNYATSCTIVGCFTAGCNLSASGTGAILGDNFDGSVTMTRCYYADCNSSDSLGADSTDLENLMSEDWLKNNLEFDFESVWEIASENYPTLRGFADGELGDVHSHSFVESSRTEATCTVAGEVVYTCRCGFSKKEIIEPLQHNYQVVYTLNPTCSTDGYIDFECLNENCTATKRQVLDRLGHDYGDDNVCDRCYHTIEIHDHDYSIVVILPTCTTMGYTEYTCSCGHTYRDAYLEPTRHAWDEGVTIDATCTVDGSITYTCEVCSATKTAVIYAEHQWSESITLEKTCTTDGSKAKVCTVCDEVVIEVIPAGHNWDEGVQTLEPTCKTEGAKTSTCLDCGAVEEFVIPELGHEYYNGVCKRCGEKFINDITPSEHPIYGMYFEIDDILSDYGPSLIDEYGLMLDYNSDANLEKVAVFLTQDGTMWRRCIAVKGTNIEYATYVPYLAYQSDIKYTGLNHDWINIFRLSENSNGVWCYNNYATIGVNLQDAYGNLLLSLYDIGQAGAETRIFDNLDAMKAWLNGGCEEHFESDWIVDVEPSCTSGSRHKECAACGEILETEELSPIADHVEGEWIVDAEPSATQTGSRHKVCEVCLNTTQTEIIPILAKLVIESVEVKAGSTVRVTVDIHNNPGIIGAVLTLNYDSALTLISAEAGSAWSSLYLTMPSNFESPCNFVWDGVSNADYNNGSIIVLTFAVPEYAEIGSVYNISATYTTGNMIDANLESVDLDIEDGSITVINAVGDVNDDGIVDVADVITLRRYLSGGYGVEIDKSSADMNNDGEINVTDVVLLRRYLVR